MYGVVPGIALRPMNVSTLLALQNTVPGANFVMPGADGTALCSSITFVCNVALATLYRGNPGTVRTFASMCLNQTSGAFIPSNAQYTAYGARARAPKWGVRKRRWLRRRP